MFRYLISKLNRKGSLLVEALLAISILSIGLTLIIQSFLSSVRATVYAADYSLATILLENKMSDLIEKGFIGDSIDEEGFLEGPNEKFRYHLETHNMETQGGSANLNQVKLSILWSSGRKTNSILLTTYLFNLPK